MNELLYDWRLETLDFWDSTKRIVMHTSGFTPTQL